MKFVLMALFAGIIIFLACQGYKNGFLKTLVSMLAIILSIAIVYLFSSEITQLLDSNTSIRETVQTSVYERIQEKIAEDGATSDETQKDAITSRSLFPESIISDFEEAVNPFGSKGDYATRLSQHIAELAVKACGIIVTLAVSFVILKVLMLVTGVVNKIPVFGMPNRIMGIALGAGRGLIAIWIICFIITVFSSTELGQSCLSAIAESKMLSMFYDGVLSFDEVVSLL